MKAHYKRYFLKFKRPVRTSQRVLTEKETWFLFLTDGKKKGVGECGLFRGLSIDDREDYEDQLKNLCRRINENEEIKQKELQSKVCERSDIVITTAQLFGRPAPKLIDQSTISKMKPGSVILDMAVESGGNVEGSIVDQVVENNGVKIVGISNLASRVAGHASVALSNNIINWITEFFDKESVSINLDFADEIIKSSVLVHQGKIRDERFK